jgi:hypothetical protein
MQVDLWAVTYLVVPPWADHDEAVKVSKQTPAHVRIKLTELYRFKNRILQRFECKLLKIMD